MEITFTETHAKMSENRSMEINKFIKYVKEG